MAGGSGTAAFAQTHIVPTVTPVRTDGGWIYWLAFLSLGLGLLLLLFLIAAYMRFAPRFSKDEDQAKVVRADRVLPGRETPRRLVDVTQAVPRRGATAGGRRGSSRSRSGRPGSCCGRRSACFPRRTCCCGARPSARRSGARPGGRSARSPCPGSSRGSRAAGRAPRGVVGPGGLRADAARAARERHRPAHRRGQGQADRDDRRAQESRRLGAARWAQIPPSSSTGHSGHRRPGSPIGTPPFAPHGRSPAPARRCRTPSEPRCASS